MPISGTETSRSRIGPRMPTTTRQPGPDERAGSAELNATVARITPAVLALLADGVPRSKPAIVAALAGRHAEDEVTLAWSGSRSPGGWSRRAAGTRSGRRTRASEHLQGGGIGRPLWHVGQSSPGRVWNNSPSRPSASGAWRTPTKPACHAGRPDTEALVRTLPTAPARAARLTAAALAAAPLLAPLPAAAGRDMTLGPVVYATLPSCDNPTPVFVPGAVYSNVSDCSVGGRWVSTGWVRVFPGPRLVPSGLTTRGPGAHGLKLSGALVEGGTLYLLERNLTRSGGMRLGRSASVAQPRVTWTGTLDFGWGTFATLSPDGYEYVYLRDSRTAYGTADRVDLARVPKGRVADLSAWEMFAGSPGHPSWVPWAKRAGRRPVLVDSDRINRPHVSRINGCWTMAVTMPPRPGTIGGGGAPGYTPPPPPRPGGRRGF